MQTVLALVLAAIALREVGILDFHIYWSDSSGDFERKFSRTRKDSEAVDATAAPSHSSTVEVSRARNPLGELVFNTLTEKLHSLTPPASKVNFSLDRADLRGLYWLPLFKLAHAGFAATYQVTTWNEAGPTEVNIEVKGELKLRVIGLCTISMFRRIMARLIADQIRAEIA